MGPLVYVCAFIGTVVFLYDCKGDPCVHRFPRLLLCSYKITRKSIIHWKQILHIIGGLVEFMADVQISITCRLSGMECIFLYDDQNTLSQFILDLQEEGMAWPKGKPAIEEGIVLDGDVSNGIKYVDFESSTLEALGVKVGTLVSIEDHIGVFTSQADNQIMFFFDDWAKKRDGNSDDWRVSLSWPFNSSFGSMQNWFSHKPYALLERLFKDNLDFNNVYVTLHALQNDGMIHTVVGKQSLEIIKDKSQEELLEKFIIDLYSIKRWICYFT